MPASDLLRDLPVLTIRTVLLFGFVLAVMRWTGKRTVSALAPFDLAVVIMMGEVAAIPIADLHVDLLHGIWPVLLLGTLHVALATLNLRWRRMEQLTEGKAALLVQDGRLLLGNMRRERVSEQDLHAALRLKGVHQLADVREVWMEHTGGISVVLKDHARPITRANLGARGGAATPPQRDDSRYAEARRIYRQLADRLGWDEPADDAELDEPAPPRPGQRRRPVH